MKKVDTKTRIVDEAILAYTDLGMRNVTSRILAERLNISHGNLEYHFKNKEILLKAIYQKMREDISGSYDDLGNTSQPIIRFNTLLANLEPFLEKYAFFNRDILEISRAYPEIHDLLEKTLLLRRKQTQNFFESFAIKGYLKPELVPGIYIRLQHTIRIIITFWNTQQEVLPYDKPEEVKSLLQQVWDLILPHLSEKGMDEYKLIQKTNW